MFGFQTDRIALKGKRSSVNDYPLQVADNTAISCFFPYLVSQDADDQIRWTKMLGMNGSNHSQPWWVNDTDLGVTGSARTGLTLLPVAQTFANDGGFVYRGVDGKLATAIKDYTGEAATNVSWTKATSPSTAIPADAAIAAFTVGRSYTEEDIDTYVMYQDEEGTIQVVWQDGGDSWSGPKTYDALGNAASGTDIACLTEGVGGAVKLSKEQDMNLCFFQEKETGRLKEVWFDGENWQDKGFVPLS
jgi:hypothetical protein